MDEDEISSNLCRALKVLVRYMRARKQQKRLLKMLPRGSHKKLRTHIARTNESIRIEVKNCIALMCDQYGLKVTPEWIKAIEAASQSL